MPGGWNPWVFGDYHGLPVGPPGANGEETQTQHETMVSRQSLQTGKNTRRRSELFGRQSAPARRFMLWRGPIAPGLDPWPCRRQS